MSERGDSSAALSLWGGALCSAMIIHTALPDYDQREWVGAWIGQRALTLSVTLALLMCLWVRVLPTHRPDPLSLTLQPAARRYAQLRWVLEALSAWGAPLLALTLAGLKLYSLLALRDVLTQSALLFASLLALTYGLSCELFDGRERAAVRLSTLKASAALGALTYAAAALHKCNLTFLNAPESCAVRGVALIAELTSAPWPHPPLAEQLGALSGVLPFISALYRLAHTPQLVAPLIITLELALAWGVWRGRSWVWPLGALFHLPLSLTIAPSFGSVMLTSYVAGALVVMLEQGQGQDQGEGQGRDDTKLTHIKLTERAPSLLLISAPLALLTAYGPFSSLFKGVLFVGSGLWGWRALRRDHKRSPSSSPSSPLPRPLSVLALLYGLHTLSPYLGVEVQHSAAMLSNLRVDPPCHNSLLAPAWGWDPYLRVDEARFGEQSRPKKEAALKHQLWGWAALNAMRRNWCTPATRPLFLKGSWWGEPFVIEDLCAPHALNNLHKQHPWSTSLPSGWQRLQKNLSRRCDQACLH